MEDPKVTIVVVPRERFSLAAPEGDWAWTIGRRPIFSS
jgi:hypothetical protein